jgi:ABC-type multidrug transport system fused ATPase/permease subunit
MAGVGVATAIFTGLRGFTFWLCGARLVKRLRATLFECLLQQPQAFHDEQGPGELSSRLATDCVKLGDVLSLNVNIVLRQVIQSLAGIAIIVRINARLAALVLCGVAIRSVFAHYYSKFSRRVSQEMQDALATSSGVAEQCFSLIKVVRSHGNAAYERERYVQQLNRLLRLDTERGAVYGFSRVFNGAVNAFLLFGILTLGAAFVSNVSTRVRLRSVWEMHVEEIPTGVVERNNYEAKLRSPAATYLASDGWTPNLLAQVGSGAPLNPTLEFTLLGDAWAPSVGAPGAPTTALDWAPPPIGMTIGRTM